MGRLDRGNLFLCSAPLRLNWSPLFHCRKLQDCNQVSRCTPLVNPRSDRGSFPSWILRLVNQSRMNEPTSKTTFLAVLIYEDGPGRRCEESRVYSVNHPEIAYQLALSDGNEQRYGRRFLGLSHLEETDEDIEPLTRSQPGDAGELVVGKDALAAIGGSSRNCGTRIWASFGPGSRNRFVRSRQRKSSPGCGSDFSTPCDHAGAD